MIARLPDLTEDDVVELWRENELGSLWPEAAEHERVAVSLSGGPDLLATARKLAAGGCPWRLAREILL